ncbi:MAG: hypothetical protein ACAI43_26050 [Phycisphaerae bacterium]|nr:hypothetical protein [Tepidisphaeraceae bacterium]
MADDGGIPNADDAAHAADVDMSLIDELLALSPTERVLRHERLLESARLLREAGVRHYGFDPRVPETHDR